MFFAYKGKRLTITAEGLEPVLHVAYTVLEVVFQGCPYNSITNDELKSLTVLYMQRDLY